MRPLDLESLTDQLTERDIKILTDVDRFRLLTTRQVQRLHFDQQHPTPLAAARACTRNLSRLRTLGVLRPLARRIGGVRAGSAGYLWYVGPAGERLLNSIDTKRGGVRRNYREPTRHFVEHTLAVAELGVQTIEAERRGLLEIIELHAEPVSWQQSLSPYGTRMWLKPDLHLIIGVGEFEQHWFIEVDLATEHLPVVLRQCAAYTAFRATGAYQARHGLFPTVLWMVPTQGRKAGVAAAVAAKPGLDARMFQVATTEAYPGLLGGPAREGDQSNE